MMLTWAFAKAIAPKPARLTWPLLLATAFTGPDWLTGGADGLEASVGTLLVLIVLSAAFLWPRKGRS